MKNYIKKGQKLPLYGVGPMIVFGMGAVTAIGIILFACVWKIGVLEASWVPFCRIAGALLIVLGRSGTPMGAVLPDCRRAADRAGADCLVHRCTAVRHGRKHC